MIDLLELRRGRGFCVRSGPARVALLHHGFRTTQMGASDRRQADYAPRYASLGLLNLARSAEVDHDNGDLPFRPEFRYFDEDSFEDDAALAAAIETWLRPAPARFVFAGLYSLAVDRTAEMLGRLDATNICIVAGGAHPTVSPGIDFVHLVVRGEGGAAVRHILSKLLEPGFGEGPDARAISFELGGRRTDGRTTFDRSLATIAAPAFAYDLCDAGTSNCRERWWKAVGERTQIYICTQSCRARCTFCSTYLIHGKLVSRPVELVAGDLEFLIGELGHDSIQFHDDDLLQHEQLDDLLALLARKGIVWTCNARAEFITPELAARMHAAGCRKVFLGVESFNQQTLDYFRKGTTVAMNRRAIVTLDAAGIGVVCGYIIGAPHETPESILSDFEIALDLPIYFLAAAILTPDIGTVEFHRAAKRYPLLAELKEKSGMSLRPRPDLFGAEAPFGLPTVCEGATKKELNELYALINFEFLNRPAVLERLRRHTLPSRLDEAYSWLALQRTKADELFGATALACVQSRSPALGMAG
ncbi:MAG TPA: B12-binding domain-containing radical SAM protein [Allosphingosinicella sp.]|jgi:hypothetical protein|nr:B12-binding domain-containing radical SAM protein [Allosphingosinicella sp.]